CARAATVSATSSGVPIFEFW
nr:immunoglobulin heavy chain junction region [Macaca mulatta]MOW47015.1 immunoglobulin heavy chain junction region [Macaca mulatta]MOW47970.1 immunoglobulin heavy chain junction region [Macaca mulatta]MOW48758.1 immunoglobulin heavy chain junction region [Macaca mulatta]MOW49507.1 immunoglobulin heavy chain junction region [Macaca mulatta]